MSKRIEWIDQYRGLAMVFVVLSHTCVAYNWLYTYTMLPMFFFISGYLHKPKSKFSDLSNRIVFRLLIPMIVFGTLPFVFQYYKTHDPHAFFDYIIGIITGRHIGWFLPCLIVIEILVYVLDLLSFKFNKYYVSVLVVIISFISMFFVKLKSDFPWSADTAIISLSFYYLGILCQEKRPESFVLPNKVISTFLLLLYLITSYVLVKRGFYFNISVNSISNAFVVFPMCVLACYVFYFLVHTFNIGKIFSWIGVNSLFIYCTNVYIHPVATHLLGFLGVTDCNTNMLMGGVNCIIQFIIMWPIIVITNKYFPFLVGKK